MLLKAFFQENKSYFPAVLLATQLKLFLLSFNSYLGNHNIMYCISMFYTHIIMVYQIENNFLNLISHYFFLLDICVYVFAFICEFVILMSARPVSERNKKWIMHNIYVPEGYDRNSLANMYSMTFMVKQNLTFTPK